MDVFANLRIDKIEEVINYLLLKIDKLDKRVEALYFSLSQLDQRTSGLQVMGPYPEKYGPIHLDKPLMDEKEKERLAEAISKATKSSLHRQE